MLTVEKVPLVGKKLGHGRRRDLTGCGWMGKNGLWSIGNKDDVKPHHADVKIARVLSG
jgi:hypothetical protein